MAQYLVRFVIDTESGATQDAHNGNSLYVTQWFDKLSKIVAESEDDLMEDIDPFVMRLLSVERVHNL